LNPNGVFQHPLSRQNIATSGDLTPKWWFSKGNPLISEKALVKYDSIWPALSFKKATRLEDAAGITFKGSADLAITSRYQLSPERNSPHVAGCRIHQCF